MVYSQGPLHYVHRPYVVRLLRRASGAQSPFARSRHYLSRRSISYSVSGHYPAFFAHTSSCADPKSSHHLRCTLGCWVFAGCCQPLLEVGPSRRLVYESFSACLNPYPGCFCGASTRFFPQNNGLPDVPSRSALGNSVEQLHYGGHSRGCSHSIIFRPADLLAPHVAPTAVQISTRQTGLLLPRRTRFVTSPSRGYANRPLSGN